MKKKVVGSVLMVLALIAVIAPAQTAEAQYITYTTYCCDSFNVIRCSINPTPIGNGCYCYNQGWGHAC